MHAARDDAFEMAATAIRSGVGVTREVGSDLAELGARKVLVVTDPVVRALPTVQVVADAPDASGLSWGLYDRVRVEATDESFQDAIACARDGAYANAGVHLPRGMSVILNAPAVAW